MATDEPTAQAAPEPALARSPSPVSAPPVQATPGPRATALQQLYGDAVTHILKTCNYENFASCFPTPAREASQSLQQLHEEFTERLGASMRMNFDQIVEERNVVPSLNELDQLIEDAKRRKQKTVEAAAAEGKEVVQPMPPHTLPAQELYLSHLSPSLSQQSEALKQRQVALQGENAKVLQRVLQQRREIEALVQGLENVVQDINGSVTVLKPEEIDSIRHEARTVDEEMRTAD
ncbi:hypothetical protein B0A48_06552 [Cryoendolithus antarcticus]|uniref:MIND kinetochore complex component Nnf1 n=1 Tax=Cryoendolithus antarcticus TaxID=1507870 RepID=A0A1V8TBV8_9PEZI|nr:hypothetical protein B0A48_06552 [Cryoendolithus antarcticus]